MNKSLLIFLFYKYKIMSGYDRPIKGTSYRQIKADNILDTSVVDTTISGHYL